MMLLLVKLLLSTKGMIGILEFYETSLMPETSDMSSSLDITSIFNINIAEAKSDLSMPMSGEFSFEREMSWLGLHPF